MKNKNSYIQYIDIQYINLPTTIFLIIYKFISLIFNYIKNKIISIIIDVNNIFIVTEYLKKIKFIKCDMKNNQIDLSNYNLEYLDGLVFYNSYDTKFESKTNNIIIINFMKFFNIINLCSENEFEKINSQLFSVFNYHDLNLESVNKKNIIIKNLHTNIKKLTCYKIFIDNISETLNNLEIFNCVGCGIKNNKNWGNKLKSLNCSSNELEELCGLPLVLENLQCENNSIEYLHLENLHNLKLLNCEKNKISQLDNLPSSLIILNCSNNQINNLDNLPLGLKILDCESNNIKQLNFLPDGLETLLCGNNKIINLDDLPNSLNFLSYNFLSELETINSLPYNLEYLYCLGSPKLKSISIIPKKIKSVTLNYTDNLEKIEFNSESNDLSEFDIINTSKKDNLSLEININDILTVSDMKSNLKNNYSYQNKFTKIIMPKKLSLWYYYNKLKNWIFHEKFIEHSKGSFYYLLYDYIFLVYKKTLNQKKLELNIIDKHHIRKNKKYDVTRKILNNIIILIFQFIIIQISIVIMLKILFSKIKKNIFNYTHL
jgi:hypothetical protein